MINVKKVENFEDIMKITVVILCVVHISYVGIFYYINMNFLMPIELMRFLCTFIFSYFVIVKNRFFKLAVFYAHLDILFFCCYYTCTLGYGYGYHTIVLLLISLAYLQNFNTFLVPIGISLIEAAAFLIMVYVNKDLSNYPNPYMCYINVINFVFTVIIVLGYIWINDRENSRILKQLDNKKEILQYKAENDYLTDLLNRRAMNVILDEKLQDLSDKKINSISLAIIDIDDFKHINDTYGHNFGDLALKKIGKIFKNEQKYNNRIHIARWGGEEFLILFENCSFDIAFNCLENLRNKIQKQVIQDERNSVNLTISIGLCHNNSCITDKDLLIKKADIALYNAKKLGKNKTIFERL